MTPDEYKGRCRAQYQVNTHLQRLTGLTKCSDCEKPALVYDHRDYNKPLDVEPVCYSCNTKRGKAIPFKGIFKKQVPLKRSIKNLAIRIPDDVHETIREIAYTERRSINWIIVEALNQYLAEAGRK